MNTKIYRLIAVAFVLGICLIIAGCLFDCTKLKFAGILLDSGIVAAAMAIVNIGRKSKSC